MSFNPMFYFAAAILVAEIFSGLYLLVEWFRHARQYAFMLYWGAGLLLLNWFQIPTTLGLMGWSLTYTNFNILFSMAMPFAFLGYILVYLGIRSVACISTGKRTHLLLTVWFFAALIFYCLQYLGSNAAQTRFGLVAQFIVFLLPLQFLSLYALRTAYAKKELFTSKMSRIGLVALMASVATAISRYVFFMNGVFVYPPQFASVLIRTSGFYVFTQIFGIALLLVGFLLIHREVLSKNICMPEKSR